MGLKKFGRYAGVVAANAFIGGAGALSQEWKRDADDKRQLKKEKERADLYDVRQAGKDETADAKSNLENALKKLNASNITESEVDEVLRNYKGSEKDTAEVKNVAAAARKRAQGTAYRDIEENLSGRQAIADREREDIQTLWGLLFLLLVERKKIQPIGILKAQWRKERKRWKVPSLEVFYRGRDLKRKLDLIRRG